MSSTNGPSNPPRQQLRSFGLIVAAGILVIGIWPMVFRNQPPRTWAIAVSLVLSLAAVLAPSALKTSYRIWMAIGKVLGWVNSRILLGTIYYLMFVPSRLILELMGRDLLNRRFNSAMETYRVVRTPRQVSHMKRQF